MTLFHPQPWQAFWEAQPPSHTFPALGCTSRGGQSCCGPRSSECSPQLLPRGLGHPEVRVQRWPPVWGWPLGLHAAGRAAPASRAYLAGPAGRGEARLSKEPGRGQEHRANEEAPFQVLVPPLSAG